MTTGHPDNITGQHVQQPQRRQLVCAGLAGSVGAAVGMGLATASQPVLAQVIKTDFEGLQAGEQTMAVGAENIPVYVARPANGQKWPVIMVVSEIFGVHEYIADVCRRFAKAGYMAVAPEFFHRAGDPGSLATIAEIQSQIVSRTPDPQVLGDIEHALDLAARLGGNIDRAGITGFCWGGRITWLACTHTTRLRCGVAWYGRLTGERNDRFPQHPLDIADLLQSPVLGLYGAADTGIPLPQVEQMQGLLRDSKNPAARDSRIRIFADAPHAFHADYRQTYRADAAREGWDEALAWFTQHLRK